MNDDDERDDLEWSGAIYEYNVTPAQANSTTLTSVSRLPSWSPADARCPSQRAVFWQNVLELTTCSSIRTSLQLTRSSTIKPTLHQRAGRLNFVVTMLYTTSHTTFLVVAAATTTNIPSKGLSTSNNLFFHQS